MSLYSVGNMRCVFPLQFAWARQLVVCISDKSIRFVIWLNPVYKSEMGHPYKGRTLLQQLMLW